MVERFPGKKPQKRDLFFGICSRIFYSEDNLIPATAGCFLFQYSIPSSTFILQYESNIFDQAAKR